MIGGPITAYLKTRPLRWLAPNYGTAPYIAAMGYCGGYRKGRQLYCVHVFHYVGSPDRYTLYFGTVYIGEYAALPLAKAAAQVDWQAFVVKAVKP
jgi:hypothetical protein